MRRSQVCTSYLQFTDAMCFNSRGLVQAAGHVTREHKIRSVSCCNKVGHVHAHQETCVPVPEAS